MTLYDRVSQLVGLWDGTDATKRMELREQLIGEVIAVVQVDTRRLYETKPTLRPTLRGKTAA